jgi:hypothetical protein
MTNCGLKVLKVLIGTFLSFGIFASPSQQEPITRLPLPPPNIPSKQLQTTVISGVFKLFDLEIDLYELITNSEIILISEKHPDLLVAYADEDVDFKHTGERHIEARVPKPMLEKLLIKFEFKRTGPIERQR